MSLTLRPLIFTPNDVPLVVDVDLARANPALAVLSAICHGGDAEVEATFPALAEALRSLGPKRAILYYDVVLAGLPVAARARWEAFMTTTVGHEYHSELFRELAANTSEPVLLGTDVHAGNVLRAQREPWLLIDPKPFVGDRTYDATQHLFNCPARMADDPHATIRRVADLLEVDHERLRLWMFARAAAEPRDTWSEASMAVARAIA